MRISQLNDAVRATIFAQYPHLTDHVIIDTSFQGMSPMHVLFVTSINVKDHNSYTYLHSRKGPNTRYSDEVADHVLYELADYQAYEGGDIGVDGLEITLGDSDDTGAVWTVGSYEVQMWVRVLNLTQHSSL